MADEYDIDSRSNYQELIQFVNCTHTTKEEGRQNKTDAASGKGTARFVTAPFTFDELVDYHSRGMTFRKLPEEAVSNWSTRFLVMDFDNNSPKGHTPVNVTKDELEQIIDMCNLTARYTPSGNLTEYHYHLFILLDHAVTSDDEYKKVRDETEQRLNTALSFLRGVAKLPRLTDPKLYAQTAVFAPRQSVSAPITKKMWVGLEWTDAPSHIEITKDCPYPRQKVEYKLSYNLVPLNTAQFARWLYVRGLADSELITDVEYNYRNMPTLPYMRNGLSKDTSKIPIGYRDDRVSKFGFGLYSIARCFNLWLADHGHQDIRFTDSDIASTYKYYINKSYETGESFDIDYYFSQLDKLCLRYKDVSDREYCELMKAKYPYHFSESTIAKTRQYVSTTTNDIVKFFRHGDTVQFGSVAERDRILRDKSVSLNALKAEAERLGLTVTTVPKPKGGSRPGAGRKTSKTENETEQTVNKTAHEPGRGRGRPATISWDSLSSKGQLVDGVFKYSIKLSLAERKFINRQGIAIKKTKTETNNSIQP